MRPHNGSGSLLVPLPGPLALQGPSRPPRLARLAPLWVTVLLVGLAGCSTPPPPPPPPAPVVAPGERFFAAALDAPSPGPADSAWWQRFDDPTLSAWVQQALKQNLDIAQARARADEAKALLRAAQASRAPQLQAQGGLQAGNRVGSAGQRVQANAALVLDWDTDLWGRLQWAQLGRAADAVQRQAELTASRLSTAALTARAYVGWVEAKLARQQLAQAIDLQREVARVVQVRVQAGLSPALDGQRARGELAASLAQVVAADSRVLDAARAATAGRVAPRGAAARCARPIAGGVASNSGPPARAAASGPAAPAARSAGCRAGLAQCLG